jgi:hypothetical protein
LAIKELVRPEPWRQMNWLLHHDTAPFFTRQFFTENMTFISYTPYSLDLAPCDFSVSHHSDATEVIKRESRDAEHPHKHDFQEAFK